MPELTDEDAAVKKRLDESAIEVPPLFVVETRNGYGRVPGDQILGVKYACVVTGLDTQQGVVVHLPLLFDWDFAVTIGLITEEKSQDLQAQAAATEPGGSQE